MNIHIDWSGMKELRHRLDQVPTKIPLPDLFPADFMSQKTDFPTFQEMVDTWGKPVPEGADFLQLVDAAWEALVKERTRFKDWSAMLEAAYAGFLRKQLRLG